MLLTKTLSLIAVMAVMAAPQEQPPRVPESIVFAGETYRFDRPDLYERMDRELIAVTSSHTLSTLMLKRADRIFSQVVPILKRNGVPEDLKYLMAIESNLSPTAISPSGAGGLWQFMKTTARGYGLEVNDEVDERFHIVKATEAACKYLKQSDAKYRDWMTVAASYNAGQGGISRRLEHQRQRSAMELWLPEETARYMFRLLTAKMFFENPAAFGFDIAPEDYYPPLKVKRTVTVSEAIPDLVKLAISNKTTYAAIKEANLWLRDDHLTNKSGKTYTIIIPEKL